MENGIFDLKEFRELIGMSQREFAEKAGISQSTLNGWENNPESLTLTNIMQIATSLGFTLDDLLNYEDKLEGKTKFSFDESAISARNATIKKFSQFKDQVDFCTTLDDLEDLKMQLQILSQSAIKQNRKLNLALFGKSDAGKSTMINTLIGEEVSPTQWSAATRSVIKFVHVDDKPASVGDDNTIVVSTSIDEESVTVENISDKIFLDKNLCAVGDKTLIKKYGLHNKDLTLEENMIYTIFSFIDSEILKGINIIDTPGTSTGQHRKGKADTNASENTRSEADLVIYASPINQFLHNEDQIYLKAILDYLPTQMDELLGEPFSNLWIVATQAQIVDNALEELQKEDGIADKSLENFMSTIPEGYFAKRGDHYTAEGLRSRFFSFSRDSKVLTEDFIRDFISAISSYISKSVEKSLISFRTGGEEIIRLNNGTIDNFDEKAQSIHNVQKKYETKKAYRLEEFRKLDEVFVTTKKRVDYYGLKSQDEFRNAYAQMMTPEYIVSLIEKKDLKNKKKDKEQLYSLVNNIISDVANSTVKKYSTEFSGQLDKDIEGFKNSFITFDFKRSFISILSGGVASGALISYMGTLGNLGGYILVTQAVGVLSSMGISVGGGAVATSAVASIGGPVTIAVGLGMFLAASVFAVSGLGWKKSLAKKIITSYEKEDCLKQYLDSIEDYWKNTEKGLEQSKSALKKQYDLDLSKLEKESKQNLDYFSQMASKVRIANNCLIEYFSSLI